MNRSHIQVDQASTNQYQEVINRNLANLSTVSEGEDEVVRARIRYGFGMGRADELDAMSDIRWTCNDDGKSTPPPPRHGHVKRLSSIYDKFLKLQSEDIEPWLDRDCERKTSTPSPIYNRMSFVDEDGLYDIQTDKHSENEEMVNSRVLSYHSLDQPRGVNILTDSFVDQLFHNLNSSSNNAAARNSNGGGLSDSFVDNLIEQVENDELLIQNSQIEQISVISYQSEEEESFSLFQQQCNYQHDSAIVVAKATGETLLFHGDETFLSGYINDTQFLHHPRDCINAAIEAFQVRFGLCTLASLVMAPFAGTKHRIGRYSLNRRFLRLHSVQEVARSMAQLLCLEIPNDCVEYAWNTVISRDISNNCAEPGLLLDLMWHNERLFLDVDYTLVRRKRRKFIWSRFSPHGRLKKHAVKRRRSKKASPNNLIKIACWTSPIVSQRSM